MKQVISLDDIASLGTIMGVWAHPDDESFMMGGLISAAIKNGQTIICVTATKGEMGSQDETKWPSATLGEVRAGELEAALALLGVTHHHWLGYMDGACHTVPDDEGISKITALINQHNPDTIISFGPDGGTGHHDHATLGRWAKEAIQATSKPIHQYYPIDTRAKYDRYLKALDEKFNFYFNLDKPTLIDENACDIVLRLTPELCARKYDALTAMPSQTEQLLAAFSRDYIEQAFGVETFVSADRAIDWAIPYPLPLS